MRAPSQRALAVWMLALLLGATAVALFSGSGLDAAASTLSRSARGWYGARQVLESTGVDLALGDQPLADLRAEQGVLVIALPWQVGLAGDELRAVDAHLRRGGSVLLAWAGAADDTLEAQVLEHLGLVLDAPRRPSLVPWRWWRARRLTWTLTPAAPALAANRPASIAAPARVPAPPPDAEVLYRGGPEALPLVTSYRWQRGRVVTLPADAWANARLGAPGNADLLTTLGAWLDGAWLVDEYHHGLASPQAAAAAARFVVLEIGPLKLTFWDLLALHLALLYGLALIAAGRRFGPAWREASLPASSTAAFLEGVGNLHHRLGHHRDAGKALVARALDLDPGLGGHAFERQASLLEARDAKGLVDLARRLAKAQAARGWRLR